METTLSKWSSVLKEEQTGFRSPIATLLTLPAVALSTYVFGFLATNIHLGKFGIFEFDLTSSRYVIVGALYYLFLASWYCFAGRSLLPTEWDHPETEPENSFSSRLEEWIGLVFLTCVSTALFSLIFLGCAEASFFLSLAVILRIVAPRWENLWESKRLSTRFPLVDSIIYPVMTVLAIFVFFATVEVDSLVMILFVHFSAMSIYGRFVIRLVEDYRRGRTPYESDREEISRSITHVCLFALLSSASFGWLQYGHIDSSLGGGQTQAVEIVVVDSNMSKSLEDMGFSVNPSFKADLVHEDENQVIVSAGSKTVQLARTSIAGVQVFSADSFGLGLYVKRIWDELRKKWGEFHFSLNRP